MQHVNVKIFAEPPVDFGPAVTVFHRWIQDSVCEELLIDVADYRHVPAGPGVVLVGHEANYSLDNSRNRPGLLYNRKAPVEDGLVQALRAALRACIRLEQEPEFEGRLRFDTGALEITINDRLLAPNTDETFGALRPRLEAALAAVYGPRPFRIERVGEPRERLRVAVFHRTDAETQVN